MIFLRTCVLFAISALCPQVLVAQDLPFPAPASMTDRIETPAGTLAIATGPWTPATGTPLRSLDGAVSQTAFRLAGSNLSTSDILAPLRAALLAQGYVLVYECAGTACGGFDFRYDLPIVPEPAMHVDLGDYHYFSAVKGADKAVALIVSRSANAGFVQVSRVGIDSGQTAPTLSTTSAPVPAAPTIAPTTPPPVTPPGIVAASDIGARLETGGALPLDDLVFPSGAATLAPGDYASLTALAAYLAANPTRRIAIVGHTDASGGLDANIALSRRRAESVRRVLIDSFGIAAAQVQAEGVGYLSPRVTNLTEAGRAANRRVEVMLLNTQ